MKNEFSPMKKKYVFFIQGTVFSLWKNSFLEGKMTKLCFCPFFHWECTHFSNEKGF